MLATLQTVGVGILAYQGLFALLALAVYLDAAGQKLPARTHAGATFVLGWAGLAVYLALRTSRAAPVPL